MEMTREATLDAIRGCLADSLALAPADITPQSRLIDDLGADSLDFVDIIFSLERKFGIKLKSAELDSLLSADFDPSRLVDNAYIPRADIDRLAEWLPAMRSADLDRVSPRELFGYITAESLVLLVERKLATASPR
jgi:acyl carrier protein